MKLRYVLTGAVTTLALAGGTALATVPAQAATTGHYPTRGYARTCHAYARWQAAGLPSARQTRTLARDVTRLGASLPDQLLRTDVSALLVAMVARTNGARLAAVVSHDCDFGPR